MPDKWRVHRYGENFPLKEDDEIVQWQSPANPEFGWTEGVNCLFQTGESLAIALATRLLQNHTVWKVKYLPVQAGLPPYLRDRAVEFIKSHLDQPFTLDQLADALGMSMFYFSRQFKQSMGVAPHQYVTRRRIE